MTNVKRLGSAALDAVLGVMWKLSTWAVLCAGVLVACSFAVPAPIGESLQAVLVPLMPVGVSMAAIVTLVQLRRGADPQSELRRTVSTFTSPVVLATMTVLTTVNVLGLAGSVRTQSAKIDVISGNQIAMMAMFQAPLGGGGTDGRDAALDVGDRLFVPALANPIRIDTAILGQTGLAGSLAAALAPGGMTAWGAAVPSGPSWMNAAWREEPRLTWTGAWAVPVQKPLRVTGIRFPEAPLLAAWMCGYDRAGDADNAGICGDAEVGLWRTELR